MLRTRTMRWSLTAVAMLAVVSTAAAGRRPLRAPASGLIPAKFVYHDGKLMNWQPEPAAKRQTLLHLGPWLVGPRTKDKPRDGRLNLYIVTPGKQRQDEKLPGWNHNLIINAAPKVEGTAADWDVYLAIVLDPSFEEDIQSETELILARQQSFAPNEEFKFEEIPGVEMLKQFLKLESVSDLEGFRRSDGTLPRLVLVPARAVIRAVVTPVEDDSVKAQSEQESGASEMQARPEETKASTERSTKKKAVPPQ